MDQKLICLFLTSFNVKWYRKQLVLVGMNRSSFEYEKDKETEKASEEENDYDDYESEEVAHAEEGSELEETLLSEKSLPPDTGQTPGSFSLPESEIECEIRLDEQRRKEKWLTLTGKKPRNIPTIKRYFETDVERIILFGDRRQIEVDKKIAERMLLAAKKLNTKARNLGKVRREVWLPALCNGLMCVRFEPNAETLTTADRNGGTQVRQRDTGQTIMNLKTIEATEKLPIRTVRYHPTDNNSLYVGGETGVIQIFNKDSGEMLATSEVVSTIFCMDISSEGSFLVTGGRNGRIHVIDPATLQVISRREWPALDETTSPEVSDQFHKFRIYGIKCHPENESLFISGGCDRSVKIWDVRVPTATMSIQGPALYGDGVDIANNIILTAAWQMESSIGLWDFSTGKLIKSVPIKNQYTKFDGEFLFTGQFFKSDPAYPAVNSNLIAVGGGGFTQLLVINIKTEKVSAHFPSYKPIFSLDVVGNMVAYGGKESVFRIGEVEELHKE